MARRKYRRSGRFLLLTYLSALLLRARSFVPPRLIDCRKKSWSLPLQFPSSRNSRRLFSQSNNRDASASPPTPTSSSSSSSSSDGDPIHKYQPRRPQVRQKPKNRRPKYYWSDLKNVEREFRELWASHNIEIDHNQPPPIPNESLLNHWKRHDLRASIVVHNGREELADALGGSMIIPGRWKEAVHTPIVQRLIELDSALDANVPPLSPQQVREGKVRGAMKMKTTTRKESGYWNSQRVIRELYVAKIIICFTVMIIYRQSRPNSIIRHSHGHAAPLFFVSLLLLVPWLV
jgi:hypothetical protein